MRVGKRGTQRGMSAEQKTHISRLVFLSLSSKKDGVHHLGFGRPHVIKNEKENKGVLMLLLCSLCARPCLCTTWPCLHTAKPLAPHGHASNARTTMPLTRVRPCLCTTRPLVPLRHMAMPLRQTAMPLMRVRPCLHPRPSNPRRWQVSVPPGAWG